MDTATFAAAKAKHRAGDLAGAEPLYRAELSAHPGNDDCLHRLGVLLFQRGAGDEAVRLIRLAIVRNDLVADYHNHLGAILKALGRLDEARQSFASALALAPDFAEVHNNLGSLLLAIGESEKACRHLSHAEALAPSVPEIAFNLGNALRALDQRDAAVAAYHRAIVLRPDYAEAHVNLGFVLLSQGAFEEGGREYDWRWRLVPPPSPLRGFTQPEWHGETVRDATVLIHAEQGLGDSIQFCRFVAVAAARCGHVVLEVPPQLVRLLSPLRSMATIVAKGEPLPPFDQHCPMLSLPWRLGLAPAGLAATVPYLAAEPDRVASWRQRLVAAGAFRIGIAWQGNRKALHDSQRSLPPECLLPLAALDGVKLFSLQRDAAPTTANVVALGPEFDAGPDAFLDTAAVMANLDLVVTSDTAIAHVAGALGIPVWVALAKSPDWRWQVAGGWYASMRLFQQTRFGDWNEPVLRMIAALAPMVANRSTSTDR